MIAIILFIIVFYGAYKAIEAMVLCAQADAWKGTANMTQLLIILVLCLIYIYLTKDYLIINL